MPSKAQAASRRAAAKKSTSKRTTAKRTTAKPQSGGAVTRPKGARYYTRALLHDAVEQGVVEGYAMRGLGDMDCPVTIKLPTGDKVLCDSPLDVLEALGTLKGYKAAGIGENTERVQVARQQLSKLAPALKAAVAERTKAREAAKAAAKAE